MAGAQPTRECDHDFHWLRHVDRVDRGLGGSYDVFFCCHCLEQRRVKDEEASNRG